MAMKHKGNAGRTAAILIAAALMILAPLVAQSAAGQKSQDKKQEDAPIDIRIHVIGGKHNEAVSNASVYLRFQERQSLLFLLHKKQKIELDLKTDDNGYATFPDMPQGKVLIQVVAPRWQTFGEYYVVTAKHPHVVIHLKRPTTHWY
jgi:hypothetical protein